MTGAAAYIRVSSRAQDHAMQRHALERAALARGDQIGTWYAEKRSAKTTAREVLGQVRADARAGHVRKLYVYRLDRLCRSGIRDMFEVVEELRGHGVELVTIADGFDLNGPAAEVVLAVLAWAAKMERIAINERIAAARERMEAEGLPWGRRPVISADVLERARSMRDAGASLRDVCRALHVKRTTLRRALAAAVVSVVPEPGPKGC